MMTKTKFRFVFYLFINVPFFYNLYFLELKMNNGGGFLAYKNIFQRYEVKYLITKEQKNRIIQNIREKMVPDRYGKTTIRNVYFDTDNFRLIRRSIEKPAYKEKLRIRSYKKATKDSTVFVELKKKYKQIVYKRRLFMSLNDAYKWLCNGEKFENPTQISNEIDYFCEYYGSLKPKAFLSYEREAYFYKEDENLRVTFDENILFRDYDISLEAEIGGFSLLDEDLCLMEIKCNGGIPVFLTEVLSGEKIYKTSFSKYGTGYINYILPKLRGEKKDG